MLYTYIKRPLRSFSGSGTIQIYDYDCGPDKYVHKCILQFIEHCLTSTNCEIGLIVFVSLRSFHNSS